MAELLKNKKVMLIIAIILIGVAIIAIEGLNVSIEYSNKSRVELNINEEFTNSEIEQIAKEVLDTKDVLVKKIGVFEDSILIYGKSISEEQKNTLVSKVNEKYSIELDSEEITITNESKIRLRDLIKPYVAPFAIATALVLGYMIIRFNKLGILKVALQSIIVISLAEGLLLSIFAITRMQITSMIFVYGSVVYIATIYALTLVFEKNRKELKNK